MTALYNDIIFGPVRSRRLGLSLGVNLLPVESKLCSFDCIYCECGWNSDHPGPRRFNSREEVSRELERVLLQMAEAGELPDVITFAGNGEPTLHPEFDLIIDEVIALRDRLCPKAKVSVLSNATQLHRPRVCEALKRVENNILKLDSAFEKTVRLINLPQGNYSVERVVEQMASFEGRMILQTAGAFTEQDYIVGLVLDIAQALLFGKGHQVIRDQLGIAGTVGNGADFFKIAEHSLGLQTGKFIRFHIITFFK